MPDARQIRGAGGREGEGGGGGVTVTRISPLSPQPDLVLARCEPASRGEAKHGVEAQGEDAEFLWGLVTEERDAHDRVCKRDSRFSEISNQIRD